MRATYSSKIAQFLEGQRLHIGALCLLLPGAHYFATEKPDMRRIYGSRD